MLKINNDIELIFSAMNGLYDSIPDCFLILNSTNFLRF